MTQVPTERQAPVRPFPPSFWVANVTELFERAAYYAMASFVVIYLGRLGMGIYIMCRDAVVRPDGLLDLVPAHAALGWLVLMGIGFASAASTWLYNRWLERSTKKGDARRFR